MDILLALLSVFIGLAVALVPVAGLLLICRPLDHQFEWEKELQGDRSMAKKDKQQGNSQCN